MAIRSGPGMGKTKLIEACVAAFSFVTVRYWLKRQEGTALVSKSAF